jgi:hypothetical protein
MLLTDGHGEEHTAKETTYVMYTQHNSDALAHFCLITMKTETYIKTELTGNVCYIFVYNFC